MVILIWWPVKCKAEEFIESSEQTVNGFIWTKKSVDYKTQKCTGL
jgi:hypothetical protein